MRHDIDPGIECQLCARIDDLERDKEATAKYVDAVEAERDALAAHVERLNEAGKAIRHELAQWALTERDPETSAAMCQFDHVARETPATSLARRDAAMEAGELRFLIHTIKKHENDLGSALEFMETRMQNLSRRAEGGAGCVSASI